MANFRDMMKENQKKLVGLVVQEETPDQAILRKACDAYVLHACDQIRREIEREKTAGHIQYDLQNTSNSSEKQKVNPHYQIHWRVEVDVNFKKKEKYYEFDLEQNVIRFGFAIPVFYVLEEMEKNLAKDQIYPVKTQEKRAGLFRKATGATETIKVKLHRPEICNGLEAASRDYEAGFTNPHMDFETGSDFAYFLTEENNEERK